MKRTIIPKETNTDITQVIEDITEELQVIEEIVQEAEELTKQADSLFTRIKQALIRFINYIKNLFKRGNKEG